MEVVDPDRSTGHPRATSRLRIRAIPGYPAGSFCKEWVEENNPGEEFWKKWKRWMEENNPGEDIWKVWQKWMDAHNPYLGPFLEQTPGAPS